MVPTAGLEPAQPFDHYHLKIACLPIPPRRLWLYSLGTAGISAAGAAT